MTFSLESVLRPSDEDDRHTVVIVRITVTHTATVEHHGAIEQRAVPIRNRLQLVEVVGNGIDVIGIQLREVLHFLGVVAVVGH